MEQDNNLGKFGIIDTIFSVEFIFAISIIFSSYTIFSLSLTEVILLVCSLYVLLFKNKDREVIVDRSYVLFLVYIVIHEIAVMVIQTTYTRQIFNNIIDGILVMLIVFSISNYIDINRLKRAYLIVSYVVSVGLLYQAIQVYILGNSVVPIQLIPALASTETTQWTNAIMRPMSCFIEPQAYATFILPIIFFLLNDKKIIQSLFFTCCILLSTSSLGILMCAFIWLFSLFNSEFSRRTKVSIIICIILVLSVFLTNSIFQYAINKIGSVDVSSDARISQGFEIYSQMPLKDQIFGIGKHSLEQYILQNDIYLERMATATNSGKWTYATTMAGILIYYGVFGFLFFVAYILKKIKCSSFEVKVFLMIIVALSFGQTILFNVSYILYYTIFFALERDENDLLIKY